MRLVDPDFSFMEKVVNKRCLLPCCNPRLDGGKRAKELSDIIGHDVRTSLGLEK